MSENTISIFDWDDTLFASTHLYTRGFDSDGDEVKQLDVAVFNMLSAALKYGSVFIVTNAENGWVEESCAKFLPQTLTLLSKCTVTSARYLYEIHHPDDPVLWKFQAFRAIFGSIFSSENLGQNNILCFGDSHVDREAIFAATSDLDRTFTKNVKFVERPIPRLLRVQTELILKCYDYIVQHKGDLDLQLNCST